MKVSRALVYKWRNRKTNSRLKQIKTPKINKVIGKFLIQTTENKFTGKDKVSSRRLAIHIKKKFHKNISYSTINKYLNKSIGKACKANKAFRLTVKNKNDRYNFGYEIIEDKVKGVEIFFTDEKRFLLDQPLNKQIDKIRMNKEKKHQLKYGTDDKREEVEKLMYRQKDKFPSGFMVAAGLSARGPGKLIFCLGNMDSEAYLRTLAFYKEDIERLNEGIPDTPEDTYKVKVKYFQQDSAACHTSKTSLDYISQNLNPLKTPWPANSPDLSPIEILWAIVQNKLYQKKEFTDLNELKIELIRVWNRIPISLCRRLCNSFDKRLKQVMKTKGLRYSKYIDDEEKGEDEDEDENQEKDNYTDIIKEYSFLNWKDRWNKNDQVERVVYNLSFIEKMKKKAIKKIKNKITTAKKEYKNMIKYLKNTLNGAGVGKGKQIEERIKKKEKDFKDLEDSLNKEIQLLEKQTAKEYYDIYLSKDERDELLGRNQIYYNDYDSDDELISVKDVGSTQIGTNNMTFIPPTLKSQVTSENEIEEDKDGGLDKLNLFILKKESKKNKDIQSKKSIISNKASNATKEDKMKFVFRVIYDLVKHDTSQQLDFEELWEAILKEDNRLIFVSDKGSLIDILVMLDREEKIVYSMETKQITLI